MNPRPKKQLVDVYYVMERCGVKKTKAREIMREVGVIRLGDGTRSTVRLDPDDLEDWIGAKKAASAKVKSAWQASTAANTRPTGMPKSAPRAANVSDAPPIAAIKRKLLGLPASGSDG